MDDLTRRAMTAYYRTGGTDQPAGGHVTHDGKQYVVLRNSVRSVLAVYRVRNDGMLKRLRRWPPGLV